jgi:uncharacterized membrane protein YhaH (DUF805 family)
MRRFWANALRLRGRASRSEYWWWVLVNFLVLAVAQISIPALLTGQAPQLDLGMGPFGSLVSGDVPAIHFGPVMEPSNPIAFFSLLVAGVWLVVTLIPGITVAVRRLHDSNLSGWWILIALVPLGPYILMLLTLRGPRFEGIRFE